MSSLPRILITSGEPAGIGPELCLTLAEKHWGCAWAVLANAAQLQDLSARLFQGRLRIQALSLEQFFAQSSAPEKSLVPVLDLPLAAAVHAGQLDARNVPMVLQQLRIAADAALSGNVSAIVTGPVQKSVINDAGQPFSGHTEFFAEAARAAGKNAEELMLLACEGLRVALYTTHVPLTAVPDLLTAERLHNVLLRLHHEMQEKFGLEKPRTCVLGLNPHAGEGGHMGREEIDVMQPVLSALRTQGLDLVGPLPADTAFTPDLRRDTDVYLAMYHDQGLPVLKTLGFHRSVNITLGLPFIRTSVDHGTALTLAGRGQADAGSLHYAFETALQMCRTLARS